MSCNRIHLSLGEGGSSVWGDGLQRPAPLVRGNLGQCGREGHEKGETDR
jgi:hypothetical protein